MSKGASSEQVIFDNDSQMNVDLVNLIKEYQPDLIGISILEIVYNLSISITRLIKDNFPNISIIAGGIFPTLFPDFFISEKSIDMVCIGEGEAPILELCEKISQNSEYNHLLGLWVKKDNKIYKNKPANLIDLNELPFPDYSEFDSRMFYKHMQGKIYKMVNIVTSRGCNNDCSFCAAPFLRKFFKQYSLGHYCRIMNIENSIKQIYYQIEKHNPEFLYFSSENFLSMNSRDFEIFIREYEKIKLPFWIQTRVETITEEKLRKLKDIGMFWLTIGLEHGNENFRNKILKRKYKNEYFVKKNRFIEKG